MTIIIDKNVKKIIINRANSSSEDEKEFHVEQDANIVLISIEEVKTNDD